MDLAFYIKCYVAMTNKQFLANQNAVGLPRHYYYQRRKTILRLDIYIYYYFSILNYMIIMIKRIALFFRNLTS